MVKGRKKGYRVVVGGSKVGSSWRYYGKLGSGPYVVMGE